MPTTDEGNTSALFPDAAFEMVGNETRIQILRTLGEREPLTFSEIYDRVEMDDTGNFTYHLDKLVGHFVRKSGDEYELREPGSIIVQAVLSGVITEAPILEPTRLEAPCPYCGSPVEVSFRGERVLVRCTECVGTYAGSETDVRFLESHPRGTIAVFPLPPAGLDERSSQSVLDAALGRTHSELLMLAEGLCPRCSASVAHSGRVCDDHDQGGDVCDACNRRRAVHVDYECTNCIRVEENIPAGLHLTKVPELVSFLSAHDVNPAVPSWEDLSAVVGYEEELLSLDPLEARFTYTIGDDVLALTIDDDLNVIGISDEE